LEDGSEAASAAPSAAHRGGLWRKVAAAAAAGTAFAALAGAAGVVTSRRQGSVGPAAPKSAALQQKFFGLGGGEATPSVVSGDEKDTCPSGYERIVDEATCRAAMSFLDGGDPDGYGGAAKEDDYPKGCYLCKGAAGCGNGVWFNSHSTGAPKKGAKPICQQNFALKTGGTVFVGDSDIDYWHTFQTSAPDAYNIGIGGNTCNDVVKEIDFILNNFKPKTVVLVCGENDLAGSASVATTYKRWLKVVTKISDSGARLVHVGTKPESATKNLHKNYQKYDEKIRAYVLSHAADDEKPPIVFVDSFKAFVERGNPNSLYDPSEKPDYLHLGSAGYSLWNKWLKLALSNTFACVVWDGDKCEVQAPTVNLMHNSANECPSGYAKITTETECNAAVGLVTAPDNTFRGSETSADWPAGCYYCKGIDGCEGGTWFNKDGSGSQVAGVRLYCKFDM